MRDWIKLIDRAITYSFYALFFATPLILHPKTFELFEFNKLWFVFYVSIFILFLWGSKIIILKKFIFRRTPLDIPIALFLVSQVISTMVSVEPHVSLWGYYSRFNGGLFSLLAYVFLYYAFVSNLITNSDHASKTVSYKALLVSLLSGFIVTLWGIPSHFGYDPTCFIFRGTLDVSCWTDAFQPTVRIFSTLGQPNWLAAYLSILIPISLALAFTFSSKNIEKEQVNIMGYTPTKKVLSVVFYLLTIIFFISLLWTKSQSGAFGLFVGIVFFASFLLIKRFEVKRVIIFLFVLGLLSFLLGNPFQNRVWFLSIQGVRDRLTPAVEVVQETKAIPGAELGGSDSGKIRLAVWKGALKLAATHPLFGTGVETFAYMYYQVKPIEHNMLSEWDYLYNKAHNEYLNYLATTGVFGLFSYLLFVFWFLFISIKSAVKLKKPREKELLTAALVSSYLSILVSNFFGFSVVVTNFYLFIIPGIFIGITGKQQINNYEGKVIVPAKLAGVIALGLICLYFESYLLRFWYADQKYAMGSSLDKVQQYSLALPYLTDAVSLMPNEDLYKDELSSNNATIALLLSEQGNSTQAAQFGEQARRLSDEVIAKHPNNIVYYKTRVRVYYALSDIDPKYLVTAIQAIQKSRMLAPTDAKIAYNLALIYIEAGDIPNAIKAFNEAIKLKPNYRDARYSFAVFYQKVAKEEKNPLIKAQYLEGAKEQLNYILTKIDPNDKQVQDLLKTIQ